MLNYLNDNDDDDVKWLFQKKERTILTKKENVFIFETCSRQMEFFLSELFIFEQKSVGS